jgi:hypothetical protein
MKLNTKIVAAAIGSLFAASVYAEPINIDLFDDPDPVRTLEVQSATTVMATDGNFPSILGGWRDVVLTGTGGFVDGARATLSVGGAANALRYSNDDGVYSMISVQWDGNNDAADVSVLDTTGLGGIDLSAATSFIAEVVQADQGFEYDIGIYDMTGNYSILSSGSLFSVVNIETHWDFAWFLLDAGAQEEDSLPFWLTRSAGDVDFSNIGAIELTMVVPAGSIGGLDLRINSITAVPEPATVALLGLGLLGLAGLRMRKQA